MGWRTALPFLPITCVTLTFFWSQMPSGPAPSPYTQHEIDSKCRTVRVFDTIDDCREAFVNINHRILLQNDPDYRRRHAEFIERFMDDVRAEIEPRTRKRFRR